MPHEIIFDTGTGRILITRKIDAPREDLLPGEGQSKLFLDFDFADRPVAAYKVNLEKQTIEARDDFNFPEYDSRLVLSSNAAMKSPIDGIPGIPADGQSVCIITVEKRSISQDKLLNGANQDNKLNIRTNAGTLSEIQVTLKRGKASFTLRSSTQTVVAEVRVWAAEIPQPASIMIEFLPTG